MSLSEALTKMHGQRPQTRSGFVKLGDLALVAALAPATADE
jgi:hypothetical protein